MKFDKKIRDEIKNEITIIESKTLCEIVPMVVQSSNRYLVANYALGVFLSILACLLFYLSPFYFLNPIYYLFIQISFFIIGFFLANISPLKKLFIPKGDLNAEVNLKSYESFLNHNLHLTKNHNGVLIFISLFEKKIKILTDKSINDKISNSEWTPVINDFIVNYQKEDLLNSLKTTLIQVGNILEKHFPRSGPKPVDENELQNDLILEIK
jgi:putative membrane protein